MQTQFPRLSDFNYRVISLLSQICSEQQLEFDLEQIVPFHLSILEEWTTLVVLKNRSKLSWLSALEMPHLAAELLSLSGTAPD